MDSHQNLCVRLDQQEVCFPVTTTAAQTIGKVLTVVTIVGIVMTLGSMIAQAKR